MAENLLELSGVCVRVGAEDVLSTIDLSIPEGELHVLLGPNGSGKSTLLGAIMGLPGLDVTAGDIHFDGERINRLRVDERARRGIGMAFQHPPLIHGVTVNGFGHSLGSSAIPWGEIAALQMNDGSSAAGAKRWEVFKLLLQDTRLLLLDEPESGGDLDHVAAVGDAIHRIIRAPDSSGRMRSALLITQTGLLLDHLRADRCHVMDQGNIIGSGDPRAARDIIRRNGFAPSFATEDDYTRDLVIGGFGVPSERDRPPSDAAKTMKELTRELLVEGFLKLE